MESARSQPKHSASWLEAAEPATSGKHLGATEFGIQLRGWRSQLRWALTQREEDPPRS
jgi:hypothetical protein